MLLYKSALLWNARVPLVAQSLFSSWNNVRSLKLIVWDTTWTLTNSSLWHSVVFFFMKSELEKGSLQLFKFMRRVGEMNYPQLLYRFLLNSLQDQECSCRDTVSALEQLDYTTLKWPNSSALCLANISQNTQWTTKQKPATISCQSSSRSGFVKSFNFVFILSMRLQVSNNFLRRKIPSRSCVR